MRSGDEEDVNVTIKEEEKRQKVCQDEVENEKTPRPAGTVMKKNFTLIILTGRPLNYLIDLLPTNC